MLKPKTNLRIVKEVYGDRKIEEVFEELYAKIYGLKVKVRRKTPEELAAEKHQEKKIYPGVITMSKQPAFKTLNQIIENYYDSKNGLIEVEKFIIAFEEDSLFVLDYKGIMYHKTSSQKYSQGYEILLLSYTELHSNSKQDLLQLLKRKIIIYFTYTDNDQQQEDFVPDMGKRIFSFMSHMLKGAQQNKRAIPVRFILMDIEAVGFIPKLPKFMAGCRGFNVGTCLFVDDKLTLTYGYNKEQVDKMYNNSVIVSNP